MEPRYAGHKNTVETDQETSLIQAVYQYMHVTGDHSFPDEKVGDKTVAERMEWAMEFLMKHRFSKQYDLIWGATTADWADVQPEHDWGVYLDENTQRAIDIYDKAMLMIALDNLTEMGPNTKTKWGPVRNQLADNCRKYLWERHVPVRIILK